MMSYRFSLTLGLLAAVPAWAPAADLATIDRTIVKEPAYRSKAVKYCLLVFGPEAKTRVWLVQDGDTLYIDRNGNGDLTEDGEKVAAEKSEGAAEGYFFFKAGDVRDGPRTHKDLYVSVTKLDFLAEQDEQVKAFLAQNPQARGYSVSTQAEVPGWKGTGIGGRVVQRASYVDTQGVLQFGDSPQRAPVVHFGGRPWQVTLFGQHKLTLGRDTDVVLGVGTPGVGPGTTTYIDYAGVIPENVYHTIEISYPPKRPGEPPVRERYELKQRC
jgi:hypothetical protein